MNTALRIYTDGASRGNPGLGGWAAIVLAGDMAMEIAGSSKLATNNQMELAAVEAVLADSGALAWKGLVTVLSDSMYVINGMTKWAKGWERNGWITSAKTPVENKAQWQNLLKLMKEYGSRLTLEKVKGHSGDLYNERCDELAVNAALGNAQTLFSGTVQEYETFLAAQGYDEKMKTAPAKSKKATGAAYSYVSMVDGVVHADKTWAACENRVKGTKGAKYKKVFSKEEETELMQDYTLQSLL
ncbi:MAG: viroplasmin family protein [Patescibacteria group bacterium]